jgi:hypothetical protein
MVLKLNRKAFDQAKGLVERGHVVRDERDAWSEHQPSARDENEFIRLHGFEEYGRWYLGIDDEEPRDAKARYKFPYGDFEKVHRGGVITAESRAGQYKNLAVEKAAARLHDMIDHGGAHLRKPRATHRATPSPKAS